MRPAFPKKSGRAAALLAAALVPAAVLLRPAGAAPPQGDVDAEVRARVRDVVKGLTSPSLDVRIRAAQELAGIKSQDGVEPLLNALKEGDDKNFLAEAAKALWEIGLVNEETVPAIAERFNGYKDWRIRRNLLEVFVRVKHPAAVPVVQQAVKQEFRSGADATNNPGDSDVKNYRTALLLALADLRDDTSVRVLEEVAREFGAPAAIDSLGRMGTEAGFTALGRLAESPKVPIALNAVRALGHFYVEHKFKDPFFHVRFRALLKAVKREEADIRSEAYRGLESIFSNRPTNINVPTSEADRVQQRKKYEDWLVWHEQEDRKKNPLPKLLSVAEEYQPPTRPTLGAPPGVADPSKPWRPDPPSLPKAAAAAAPADPVPPVETYPETLAETIDALVKDLIAARNSDLAGSAGILRAAASGERNLTRNHAVWRALERAAEAGEGKLLHDAVVFHLRDRTATELGNRLPEPTITVLRAEPLNLTCAKGVKQIKQLDVLAPALPAVAEIRCRMSIESGTAYAVFGAPPDRGLYLRFDCRREGVEIALGRTVPAEGKDKKVLIDAGEPVKHWMGEPALWPAKSEAEVVFRLSPGGFEVWLNGARAAVLAMDDPAKSFPDIAPAWGAVPGQFGFGIVRPGRYSVRDVRLLDASGQLGPPGIEQSVAVLRAVTEKSGNFAEEARRRRETIRERLEKVRALVAAGEGGERAEAIAAGVKRAGEILRKPAVRPSPEPVVRLALAADRPELADAWIRLFRGKDWADPDGTTLAEKLLAEHAGRLQPPSRSPQGAPALPGWTYRVKGGTVLAGKGMEDVPLLVLAEGDSARRGATVPADGTWTFLAQGRDAAAALSFRIGAGPAETVLTKIADGLWHEVSVEIAAGSVVRIRIDRRAAASDAAVIAAAAAGGPGPMEFTAKAGTWKIAGLAHDPPPPPPPVKPGLKPPPGKG